MACLPFFVGWVALWTLALAIISEFSHLISGFLWGATLVGANVFILAWSWWQIIEKKAIALAGAVIVVKYAIFGGFVYFVALQPRSVVVGFLLGFSTLIPTLIGLTLYQKRSV